MGSGFKTPEGYFESIEDHVCTKLSTAHFPVKEGFKMPANYLESIEANVFEQLSIDTNSDKQSTEIPEGYFDTFEDRVFAKIQKETAEKSTVIHLKSRLIKIVAPIAIAASLVLIIILNYSNNAYNIESVATSDIEEWIEDDLISFDSYEIAELYDDVNLEDEFSNDDLDVLNYINGTDIESVLLTD